jgi:uncharacterized membrane protein
MHNSIINDWWSRLRASYWFVPGIMVLAAIALSFGTIALDNAIERQIIRDIGLIWSGGVDGGRELLAVVATSMITVAGVTFSITIVALSLASSQLGPRLLRNFMRDTGNQIVLGTFVSTFVYCLLVLRTIRGTENGDFVPYISITVALILALGGIGVLIYFIHHTARSIQVPVAIAGAGQQLLQAIGRLFPSELGASSSETPAPAQSTLPEDFEEDNDVISADKTGYLTAVDEDRLLSVAIEKGIVVQLFGHPGYFIVHQQPLMWVYPAGAAGEDGLQSLRQSLVISSERTEQQDLEYNIEQIVEVAVRALSPGVYDTYTALTCIDWLSAALEHLVQKEMPSPFRYDDEGSLRVYVPHCATFERFLSVSFDQIRHAAAGTPAVRIRLLDAIRNILVVSKTSAQVNALLRQADMIRQAMEDDESIQAAERQRLYESYQEILQAIKSS